MTFLHVLPNLRYFDFHQKIFSTGVVTTEEGNRQLPTEFKNIGREK